MIRGEQLNLVTSKRKAEVNETVRCRSAEKAEHMLKTGLDVEAGAFQATGICQASSYIALKRTCGKTASYQNTHSGRNTYIDDH